MTYEKVKNLNPEEFKRFCGVYPETFKDMVKVLAVEKVLQKKSGRPSKLSLEDQILMTLEYLREYRTYFPECLTHLVSGVAGQGRQSKE